jgi:hypothetical protein
MPAWEAGEGRRIEEAGEIEARKDNGKAFRNKKGLFSKSH